MEMPFSDIREYHNGNCDCSRKLLKSTRFGAKNHSFSLLPRAKLVTTLKPPPFKEGGSLTFASPLAAKCRTMASSYHLQRDYDYICMGNEFCRKKWRTFLKRETLSISPQGDFCPFVSKSAPQGVQTFFRPKTFFPYSDLGYKYASLPLSNSQDCCGGMSEHFMILMLHRLHPYYISEEIFFHIWVTDSLGGVCEMWCWLQSWRICNNQKTCQIYHNTHTIIPYISV